MTTFERRASLPAPTSRQAFLLFVLLSGAISLLAMSLFDHVVMRDSVFQLSNWVGPTAETLMHGKGLTVCSEGLGTLGNPICFHAARMPLPSAVVALGVMLVGDHYLRVAAVKVLLMLLPLELAALLVCRRLPATSAARWLSLGLLLLPFAMTTFLADVVNMQVEEGYSYSLLALASALVFFPAEVVRWRRVLLFAVTVAALYLAKSSMVPAVAVLTIAFLWPMRRMTAKVAAVVLLVALAPAGWAMWQHHAAGRYTLGTSIDGVNLHKGNNEIFLAHYPPRSGETLDIYDSQLSRGHHFDDEWSFNDFHQKAAVLYIRTHPKQTAEATWRKLDAILFSVRKLGSQPRHGAMEVIEDAGIVMFRLLFWAAMVASVLLLWRGGASDPRYAAGSFLLLVGAVALPYLAGFAYTRHISILIYPSALLCCRAVSWKTEAAARDYTEAQSPL